MNCLCKYVRDALHRSAQREYFTWIFIRLRSIADGFCFHSRFRAVEVGNHGKKQVNITPNKQGNITIFIKIKTNPRCLPLPRASGIPKRQVLMTVSRAPRVSQHPLAAPSAALIMPLPKLVLRAPKSTNTENGNKAMMSPTALKSLKRSFPPRWASVRDVSLMKVPPFEPWVA